MPSLVRGASGAKAPDIPGGRDAGLKAGSTQQLPQKGRRAGYTSGMKTAVSIPDDIFERAEQLAKRTKRSRSRVFSDALREYVTRHSPDEITSAVNKACVEIGPLQDPFSASAARSVLYKSEW